MRKAWIIAVREYQAAVRSKYFVFSVVIVLLLVGGSALLNKATRHQEDLRDRRFAVVDRSGAGLLAELQQAAQELEQRLTDPASGRQARPRYILEPVAPADDERQQLFDLSERVRQKDLDGVLVIEPAEKDLALRYYSESAAADRLAEGFPRWAAQVVSRSVQLRRGAEAGLTAEQVQALLQPVPLQTRLLLRRDPASGTIEESPREQHQLVQQVPFFLVMAMYMAVMIGSSLGMQAVLEEKMQRIYEVLLGSVRPFELMLGKLLGMTGLALTLSLIYLGAAYWAAHWYGLAGHLPLGLLPWFIGYLVLATLLFGSLSLAVGSACNDLKESQVLYTPVVIIAILPMSFLPFVMESPQSPLAVVLSLFPPATPMLMLVRQASPAGVPWWQPALGVVLLLAATAGCVWAAARIFRVGILMQGKSARLRDVVRWLVSGE